MLARPARRLVARTIAWVDPDERIDVRVCWHAAVTGTLLGVYSHIALDSIMHDDVHPPMKPSVTLQMRVFSSFTVSFSLPMISCIR
jgi:hypothetical protein